MPMSNSKSSMHKTKTKTKIKTKKGEKGKVAKNRSKNNKTKKNLKIRISVKNMSKRKLKKTVKKANQKRKQRLNILSKSKSKSKYMSMKGGAGTLKKVEIKKEVPQDPNQSASSIEATKLASEVLNDANVLNQLNPDVVESFSGLSSTNGSIFSSQPFLLGGGSKHKNTLPTKLKQRRKTIKRQSKLLKKY